MLLLGMLNLVLCYGSIQSTLLFLCFVWSFIWSTLCVLLFGALFGILFRYSVW